MKKERNTRKELKDLYFYFDYLYFGEVDDNLSENEMKRCIQIEEKYKKKYSDREGTPNWWKEYYGLFRLKNGRVGIDPKRMNSMLCNLDDQQLDVMNKRNTTYFHPCKKEYSDYDVNVLVNEVKKKKKEFIETYKPMIDSEIKKIKRMKPVYAGDYDKLMMGISGVGSASAWANYKNVENEMITIRKKRELYNSLYSQFFHSMASRIEAITIKVFKRHNPKLKSFNRNTLYSNINTNGKSTSDLPSFKYHDKLYRIWNFIKHNSESTYEKLKKDFPEVLHNEPYVSGDLAIRYLKLNEKLILELLEGVKQFFIEWCELNVNEKYSQAWWNYDKWFIKKVEEAIEMQVNPLRLTAFDEMD